MKVSKNVFIICLLRMFIFVSMIDLLLNCRTFRDVFNNISEILLCSIIIFKTKIINFLEKKIKIQDEVIKRYIKEIKEDLKEEQDEDFEDKIIKYNN